MRDWKKVFVIAVEWGDHNHMTLDNTKNETIKLMIRRKLDMTRRIMEATITVRGDTIGFIIKRTR